MVITNIHIIFNKLKALPCVGKTAEELMKCVNAFKNTSQSKRKFYAIAYKVLYRFNYIIYTVIKFDTVIIIEVGPVAKKRMRNRPKI